MMNVSPPPALANDPRLVTRLLDVVQRHWGFTALRPLQEAAMRCVLAGRDSLLVLPTGGGKSLCYQAPAVLRNETTVVVSPLISLMKDQVDALRANGVPAVQLNSSLSMDELREAEGAVLDGSVRLVFVSPERMATGGFRQLLKRVGVRAFAIDEAHCISHWGHDFRPEYRQLQRLKELFPDASINAFTATATEQVRRDIVEQLGLREPEVLIGNFDRPNLTYRVVPRHDLMGQVLEVIERHRNEAGIIYCIRRRDVDDLTTELRSRGFDARPYHAGLTPDQRHATQEAFADEKCDLVVATVAFGMGIDRSNIRFVLHTGMPKTIEHYQQETGRAGRDGLEAECVLLYSPADAMLWRSILEKSVSEAEGELDPEYLGNSLRHIADMERYCHPVLCRHRSLVEYFGQTYPAASCQACDLCLGDADPVDDGQTVAKKILSCVARVNEQFGMNHVIGVLRGENTAAIRKWQHEELSTYGLLKAHEKAELRDWIQQLIGQGVLVQTGDTYPVLKLNPGSWDVMKDRRTVQLLSRPTAVGKSRKSKADTVSWEGVDRDLFEALRAVRRQIAEERGVAPYVIFSDATLRELARVRPSGIARMHQIYGVGEAKLAAYGERFLEAIDRHCREHGLSRDRAADAPPPARPRATKSRSAAVAQAFELFREGTGVEDVAARTGRSRSTVMEYLSEYIREERPGTVSAWIGEDVYRQVTEAVEKVGTARLKPIFIELSEKISYDEIRIVVAHLETLSGD